MTSVARIYSQMTLTEVYLVNNLALVYVNSCSVFVLKGVQACGCLNYFRNNLPGHPHWLHTTMDWTLALFTRLLKDNSVTVKPHGIENEYSSCFRTCFWMACSLFLEQTLLLFCSTSHIAVIICLEDSSDNKPQPKWSLCTKCWRASYHYWVGSQFSGRDLGTFQEWSYHLDCASPESLKF